MDLIWTLMQSRPDRIIWILWVPACDYLRADMEAAENIIGSEAYDVVLCCGVLMYVNESIAEKVVRLMFARAARLAGLFCLAPPEGERGRKGVRASDGAFIHDLDPLIRKARGNVLSSRWIGTTTSGSSPSHVIVAEPALKTMKLPARLEKTEARTRAHDGCNAGGPVPFRTLSACPIPGFVPKCAHLLPGSRTVPASEHEIHATGGT